MISWLRRSILPACCLGIALLGAAAASAKHAPSGIGPEPPRAVPGTRWPALSGILAIDNPAQPAQAAGSGVVSVEMISGEPVGVGSKVSFRVRAKKQGYLLLVDVDATGAMTQIFPSAELLAQSDNLDINLIRPGESMVLPPQAAAEQGFQYVITPPTGPAAVIAILSEKRVQLLDLPDMPKKMSSEADVVSYLAKWTSELRIPDVNSGKLQQSNWWFDVKSYAIQ